MQAYKKRGFWVGLGVFFLVILSPSPESLSPIGWAVAAVTLLMAIWWATEAVPVAVTALLPLALFPLLQVTDFKAAALPYANPNIYLFMGGFILALGIESSGLHKRLALKMLILVGNSGAKLVGGFMLVSAVISMWVMNTSTTLMLLPIGLAVCASVAETIPNFSAKQRKNFETSLLLGIAYAASIGGMSTLVGTAPNIIFPRGSSIIPTLPAYSGLNKSDHDSGALEITCVLYIIGAVPQVKGTPYLTPSTMIFGSSLKNGCILSRLGTLDSSIGCKISAATIIGIYPM